MPIASTPRSPTSCAYWTRKHPLCSNKLGRTTLRRTTLGRTTLTTGEQGTGPANVRSEVLTSVTWLRLTSQRRSDHTVEQQNHVWRVQHLRRLLPRGWLNDEVISAYMDMLQARCDQLRVQYRCSDPHNIFVTLVNIFPVNIGRSHWCLCVVDPVRSRIDSYEPIAMRRNSADNLAAIENIRRYLLQKHSEIHLSPPVFTVDWPTCPEQ